MAEYILLARVEAEDREPGAHTVRIHATAVDGAPVDAEWFAENSVQVEPGTGDALKAVAATAIVLAINGGQMPGLPGTPANDEPSAAERGEFNEDMMRAVARIGHNVIREWRRYEGLLHNEPFDSASELAQNTAITRIKNIVGERRYPLDIANKAMVFEDQLYRVIASAVLAD